MRMRLDNKTFDNMIKEELGEKVNHPAHYNRSVECIDEMIAVFGKEKVADFCLCNVWKYRYRAGDKNGAVDLEKSDWYMKKYLELTNQKVSSKDDYDYWG